MALQNLTMEIGVAMQQLQDGLSERLPSLPAPLGQHRSEGHVQQLSSDILVQIDVFHIADRPVAQALDIAQGGGYVVTRDVGFKPSGTVASDFQKEINVLSQDHTEGLELAGPRRFNVHKLTADAPEYGVDGKLVGAAVHAEFVRA